MNGTDCRRSDKPVVVLTSDGVDQPSEGWKNDKFKRILLFKRRTYQQYFAKSLSVALAKLEDWQRLCAIGNPTGLRSRRGGSLNRIEQQVAAEKEERKKQRRLDAARERRRKKGLGVIEGASGLLSEYQMSSLKQLNQAGDGLTRKGAIRKALRHHEECKRLTSGCNCSTGNRKQYASQGIDPPDPPILHPRKKKKGK